MFRLIKTGLIPACTLLLLACTSPTRPETIIKEETYIDLLAEIHILNAIDETYPDSTLREESLHSILQNYSISIEDFEKSHNYYYQDVAAQRRRLEKAERRLQQEYDRLNSVRREQRERQSQAPREMSGP